MDEQQETSGGLLIYLLWQSRQTLCRLVRWCMIRRSRFQCLGRCRVASRTSRSIKRSFRPHTDLRAVSDTVADRTGELQSELHEL